jgi:ADA HAT complex component 1
VPRLASNMPPNTMSTPFTASSQAPRLSAQFAKYNLGGNLERAIASARQKIDLGTEEEFASPDTLDLASPLTVAPGARMVPGASLGGAARPRSRKGHREPAQRRRPSSLATGPANAHADHHRKESLKSPQDNMSNLSPHAADSNPGLVSDHEDDDHGSASEDEVPQQTTIAHSLGVRRGDCSDNMDVDITVDDDMDQHGVLIRRNSMIAAEERGLRTSAAAAGSPSRKLGGGIINKGA